MSSTAMPKVYSGERHVCTRIDKFENGLTFFDILNRDQFFALNTVEYRTLLLCKSSSKLATRDQSIITVDWYELLT